MQNLTAGLHHRAHRIRLDDETATWQTGRNEDVATSGDFDPDSVERWRRYLSQIQCQKCPGHFPIRYHSSSVSPLACTRSRS